MPPCVPMFTTQRETAHSVQANNKIGVKTGNTANSRHLLHCTAPLDNIVQQVYLIHNTNAQIPTKPAVAAPYRPMIRFLPHSALAVHHPQIGGAHTIRNYPFCQRN
ncbi:hypothetical protein T265_00436 [Opisthorchis viverrini]|uniref:Uncharacterized protein n=1 Tax=Opisthorchis viverrini TaxID=6198 RepID=A0A075A330_OPIVI|nr:hypothetical protein T265_00436 [Opisthorchis viverrini]KER33756.1 hypothetical protein T265_00436 [Opisthorchis viverrini]